jgi:hypothetical protein
MCKSLKTGCIVFLALSIVLTEVAGPRALGDDGSKVFIPSDLLPPCTIADVKIMGSDITLGFITLADKRGFRLSYGCSIGSSGFANKDNHWVASHPGDSEEVLFLKLLKEAYAKIYDAKLDGIHDYRDPKIGPATYQARVKTFVDLLEERCATKKESLRN